MSKLDRLQRRLDAAQDALAAEVNRLFPEGSRVNVARGNGTWRDYVVASGAVGWHGGDEVLVRGPSGKGHRVHFSNLELL